MPGGLRASRPSKCVETRMESRARPRSKSPGVLQALVGLPRPRVGRLHAPEQERSAWRGREAGRHELPDRHRSILRDTEYSAGRGERHERRVHRAGAHGWQHGVEPQAAGHTLAVNDLRKESAARHLEKGAAWKDTRARWPRPATWSSPPLPGPPEVTAVATGASGLLEGMRRGSALFDLSTNAPAVIRRLHATFAEKGRPGPGRPVSGGPAGARSRKLAIWVGGEPRRLRPAPPVARGDGRSALLRRPHRRGRGGQARPQLRELHHPRRASPRSSAWASRPAWSPISSGRPSARGRAGARAPSIGSWTSSCPAASTRPPSRSAGPQGRLAGHRAGPRGGRAHAPGQPRAGGDDRGAQSRLG